MHDRTPACTLARLGTRALAITGAIAVLIVGTLVLDGPRAVWGDHPNLNCAVTDLGTLGAGMDRLQTEGRWTTEDCDSRFLPNSDAHMYRFELAEDGHVRIDLTSPDGDSYIHLLAEDGSRIAHDDDGGYGLDSRVEYNLTAGSYLVEASLGSGRVRGPADFTLTVRRVTNCDPVDLGTLESGGSLEVEGVWTADDCRARYRDDTPAQTFRFELLEEGLVRIDLGAGEGGDPFLYLLSADGAYIQSDDDDGGYPDSRIEADLGAGAYLIEATTFGGRDHVHLLTDFALTLSFVTPDAFQIKTEAIHVPDQVVAGDPFTVHYRVGNLGHTDLPEASSAVLYLAAPGRVFDRTAHVPAAGGNWRAGASYHSGPETASRTSTTLDVLRPLTITIREPGPSWVVLAIFTDDEFGQEIGHHRIERDLLVLSGPTFGPGLVRVDGATYEVTATADEEGLVTTAVSAVADPETEVDAALRAKAIYVAGVRTQLLDGIFTRSAIAALPEAAGPATVDVASPASSALRDLFADHYTSALATAGLAETVAAGGAIHAAAAETMAISAAEAAVERYAALAASWRALQERIAGGGHLLTFTEAVTVQAELAYAEGLVVPAVTAGAIVEAARAAEGGWQDPAVQARVAALAASASCADGPSLLGDALEAAGVAGVDALLTLDAELRAALPVHGLATDSALCAAAGSDAATGRFLGRLALAGTAVHQELVSDPPPAPAPAPAPYQLRIVAQLLEDGQIELGVEFASGERILPVARLLPTDATVGHWHVSSAIEADGNAIGKIRVQRLIDGRVELGFRDAGGTALVPVLRYLAADLPAGIWHRSSAIEVSPAAAASE